MVEIIGFIASFFVLISLLAKTSTYEGALILRILNAIGSGIFVIYGIMLPAYSTAFLNAFAFIINIYFILRMKKDYSDNK